MRGLPDSHWIEDFGIEMTTTSEVKFVHDIDINIEEDALFHLDVSIQAAQKDMTYGLALNYHEAFTVKNPTIAQLGDQVNVFEMQTDDTLGASTAIVGNQLRTSIASTNNNNDVIWYWTVRWVRVDLPTGFSLIET